MDDPGHIEGANTSTLIIINGLVTDWGMYSCEATNIVNSATSDNATLHGKCLSVCLCACMCMSVSVYINFVKYSNKKYSKYIKTHGSESRGQGK